MFLTDPVIAHAAERVTAGWRKRRQNPVAFVGEA